jgi:hypothetical protein
MIRKYQIIHMTRKQRQTSSMLVRKRDCPTQAKADSICQQRKLHHESNNDTILWQRKITIKATTIPAEQDYYIINANSILQQRKDHKSDTTIISSRGRITITAMLLPFTS